MLPQNIDTEFKKITKRVVIVVTFLATSAFFFTSKEAFWGIIIGAIMSIINFRLIALSTVQILELDDPSKAKAKATVKYLIRAFLTIGVMFIGFTNDKISFPALVVGLLLVKYIILSDAIYRHFKDSISNFYSNLKLKYERRDK